MQKIIVAITGASGAIYAQYLLQRLCEQRNEWAEIALVVSDCGQQVFIHELGQQAWNALLSLPVRVYDRHDFFAPIASGSAGYEAMVVVPCSMTTLARIAHGIADNLIARAADVMLKERKRLVVVPRETPYSLIHLQNMQRITEAGGIVCPASPAFYSHPATLAELSNLLIERVLQLAGAQVQGFEWGKQLSEL
ncbi:flavin prenyltransferase UbiX [Bacteroidia bacterium]|nr:flavin prenyltransferase UbiX [Bacteroidia bacterium]